jgi:isochorismate synthase
MQNDQHGFRKKNNLMVETIFAKAQVHYLEDLPFVLYKKPNEIFLNAFFQTDDDIYCTDDFSENGFVFCEFISKKKIIFNFDKSRFFSEKYKISAPEQLLFEEPIINELDKIRHLNLVQKGIDSITNGDFSKVVLSRKEIVAIDNFNILESFKKLLNQNENAFSYVWYHPKIGMWMGAFGEQLLKVEENNLSTMSLAGTQKIENLQDINWSAKEIDEQNIVTEYIIQTIELETTKIELSEIQTIYARNVAHLKTNISAALKPDFSLKNIVNKLHPTPAVCGFPKDNAKKFILENENYDREFYAGFLGELNFYKNNSCYSNLFVNLRCMKISENYVTIYVGGGITKDSIPEQEWQETVNKSVAMKQILNQNNTI